MSWYLAMTRKIKCTIYLSNKELKKLQGKYEIADESSSDESSSDESSTDYDTDESLTDYGSESFSTDDESSDESDDEEKYPKNKGKTVKELKKKLASLGLPVSGNKPELEQRLNNSKKSKIQRSGPAIYKKKDKKKKHKH